MKGTHPTTEEYPVPPGVDGLRLLSPTDLSQYIMLGQCQRHLRLRLHQRRIGTTFLRRAGVTAQEIPPLRTRSGEQFEYETMEQIEANYRLVDLRDEHPDEHGVVDNARLVELARELSPGDVIVLAQPLIEAPLSGWLLRGKPDLIRLGRAAYGGLHLLAIDIKRSAQSRVEHRLQAAFYDLMLTAIFAAAGLPLAGSDLGIFYKGPNVLDPDLEPEEQATLERHATAALDLLGVDDGLLDVVDDPETFRAELARLVFDPDSMVSDIAERPFAEVPFHLCARCDMCLYAPFCLRWSKEHGDLSLVPHLSERDKTVLKANGVHTVADLGSLKEPWIDPATGEPNRYRLVPPLATAATVQKLHVSPPVGPHLDELIYRARRLQPEMRGLGGAPSFIPNRGPTSLPASTPDLHPNLVRVFIDVQSDYLTGRLYLAGALVSAAREGEEAPARQRTIVHMTGRAPEAADEAGLLIRWVRETLQAIDDLAAPDPEGGRTAPIHIVLWSETEQKALLEALDRNAADVLGATALREFLTQLAGFESPLVSLLNEEIRTHTNYPMLGQSLQTVARFLRFDWGSAKQIFKRRHFDDIVPLERGEDGRATSFYTGRSRFSSLIPLEYAYGAWDDLPPSITGTKDIWLDYRGVTTADLVAFQERRLEALHHIAARLRANPDTTKTAFSLPDLGDFSDRARTLADALEEFVLIERQVELAEWRRVRNAPPEQRVLAGVSLLACYRPEDQSEEIRERNRHWLTYRTQRAEAMAALQVANPEAAWGDLPPEAEAPPPMRGQTVRLRVETTGVGAGLTEVLGLSGFREGDWVLTLPRWTVDSRLAVDEQVRRAQTPKQLLYGLKGTLSQIEIERDDAGRAARAWLHFTLDDRFAPNMVPFAFPSTPNDFFVEDDLYTIEENPNDLLGYGLWKAVQALTADPPNALFERLASPDAAVVNWPAAAGHGQQQFLAGLQALSQMERVHGFRAEVQEYVGQHGADPLLLVQGPPGTGKSYITAFALFARMQGAMATGAPLRAGVSASTHAAVDVLLTKLVEVQRLLRGWHQQAPAVFADHFDPRLLGVALFRFAPRTVLPVEVVGLNNEAPRGQKPLDYLNAVEWCVVAGTPSALKNLCKGRKAAPGNTLDLLVLDEASRMTVPEAIMAAIPLKSAGAVMVVGDHRQMQPIRKHDWDEEPRKTFQEYKVYRSVFDTVRALGAPTIRLSESHRLHEEMAEFLRQEIYRKDEIDFRSAKRWEMVAGPPGDPYVDAVLRPEFPIVVVVHDEAASQLRNETERDLIAPLAAEVVARGYGWQEGFGIVVPHRAQRALLQQALRPLTVDNTEATAAENAVDTVERFQGGEREVIVISATESDPAYLLAAGEFLYDPTRLTVALSRAKRKLILVAARSVFSLFSPDDEVWENALVWKNLLRRTCTELLWAGTQAGHGVQVWGRLADPAAPESDRVGTGPDDLPRRQA